MDLRVLFDFSHSTLGVAVDPARLPQFALRQAPDGQMAAKSSTHGAAGMQEVAQRWLRHGQAVTWELSVQVKQNLKADAAAGIRFGERSPARTGKRCRPAG
ncbi:hypothetical protein CBM2586_A50552 [Cupriavidus phytorum]|uniref:Uncharacterized protein n=1 Tax=Cupriavidus taiwanensis TaxID=164546 RepID=A0A375C499_9BURK|nr:hypothetical protein CBM2586_A50552 [Cupriavidus taiwanensis]